MYRQRLRFYADGGQEIPPELQEYVQGVSPFTEADTVGVYPGQDPYAGMSDEDKRMIINQQLYDAGVGGKNYLNPVHVGQAPWVILPEVDYPVGQIPAPEGYVQTEGQVPQQVVVDGVDVTNGVPTEGEMPQAEGVLQNEGDSTYNEVVKPYDKKVVKTTLKDLYQQSGSLNSKSRKELKSLTKQIQELEPEGQEDVLNRIKESIELGKGTSSLPMIKNLIKNGGNVTHLDEVIISSKKGKSEEDAIKENADNIDQQLTKGINEANIKNKMDKHGIFHYNDYGELYVDTNKLGEFVVDGRASRDEYNAALDYAKKNKAKYMSPEDLAFSDAFGAENVIRGIEKDSLSRTLKGVGQVGLNIIGTFAGAGMSANVAKNMGTAIAKGTKLSPSQLKLLSNYTGKTVSELGKMSKTGLQKLVTSGAGKLAKGAENFERYMVAAASKAGQATGKGIKAFANGVDAVDNMILNGANAAGKGANALGRGVINGAKAAYQGVDNAAEYVARGIINGSNAAAQGVNALGRGTGKLLVNGANQLMDNAAFVGRASADLGQYIGQGAINGANYIANATINGAIKGGNGIIRIGNTLYQNTANGLVALKNSPYGPAIAGGTVGGLVGGGLVHYLSKDDEEENTEE